VKTMSFLLDIGQVHQKEVVFDPTVNDYIERGDRRRKKKDTPDWDQQRKKSGVNMVRPETRTR